MSQSSHPCDILEGMSKRSDTVRLRVWRGSVSVLILPPESLDSYAPLRLRIPRLSYLPIFYDRLREHFNIQSSDARHLLFTITRVRQSEVEDVTWSIVQTHHPVGLIYDLSGFESTLVLQMHLIYPEAAIDRIIDGIRSIDATKQKEPTKRVQAIDDDETPSLTAIQKRLTTMESFVNVQHEADLTSIIWNNLKQATVLRYGTVRDLQNLTPLQSESLRRAILQLDFVNYWKIARRITSTSKVRYVPVRILVQRRTIVQDTDNHKCQELRTTVMQDLLPLQIGRTHSTVSSLLKKFVPFVYDLGEDQVDVVLHGCIVTWSLQLRELLEECIYADGWLYLVLRPKICCPRSYDSYAALPDNA